MKLLRIINKQGLFIRDDFSFDELTEIGLDVEASQGLYQPKWNFELEIWQESATQEYIDSLKPKESIEDLKAQLADTDYKIIKCMEYQLAGLPLPYDIETLHLQRQAVRDRIAELEAI